MKTINLLFLLIVPIQAFILSVGGFEIQKYPSLYSFHSQDPKKTTVPITELLKIQSPNVNSVTMWITKEWQEGWYESDTINSEIVAKGYIPVFVFYYFEDAISKKYVTQHTQDYFSHLKRFIRFLHTIKGKKIVILNPEYNMNGVGTWDKMDSLLYKSITLIHSVTDTKVGPCVGDFGNYAKTNEPQEWKLFAPSLKKSSQIADFIAFQEMRALTRNTPNNIQKTAQRAYHLANFLYKTYHKPTFLAYLAISSYQNETLQADVYKEFLTYIPKMKQEAHLLGFGTFHYFDYPNHQGYFNKAEEHFGVVTKDNIPKPAFFYFNKLH